MSVFLLSLIVFLSLLEWAVFFDIVLSFLRIVGIRFRPTFLGSITDPLYDIVRRALPTAMGRFDFSPLIVLIGIQILANLILTLDPSILDFLSR